MSIANLISALINEKFVAPFIDAVSAKYDLNKQELETQWNNIANGGVNGGV